MSDLSAAEASPLLSRLRAERATRMPGGIYHKEQIIAAYETTPSHVLDDIVAFHVAFERIHPFQDGNGRVGRLVMFKECLRHAITPFVISDDTKLFYYRGLARWDGEKGRLRDTCLAAQDTFKEWLNYYRIPFAD